VRVVSCLSLLAVCAGLAGCRSLSPKSKAPPPASVPRGGAAGGGSGAPFWAAPNAPRGPGPASVPGAGNGPTGDPVAQPGNDPEVSGILAGRVVDGFGRSPGSAFIQVGLVGDAAPAPIEVETVNQGAFYIRGLQPGRTYRLVARARVDGRLLVGEAVAKPPAVTLLIPMREDLAGASTPPLPGAPQPPRGRPASGGPAPVPPPDAPWPSNPAAELGAPRAGGPAFGPVAQPEQVATTPPAAPPRASIPGPTPVPPAVPGLPSTAPIQPQSYSTAPAPTTPACYIANGRVHSLSLADLNGGTWDFSQRRGRLVLLDFWGSWCVPCLKAIPDLVRLQSTYGGQGLEVIGIACERGPAYDHARPVRMVRQKIPSINYRLLLAEESGRCPVQAQFQIRQYPTLVLLDADGTIVWRGGPDQMRTLEQIIRRRLGP
jgi:thiol-disulfide isomerase/thioredoxin